VSSTPTQQGLLVDDAVCQLGAFALGPVSLQVAPGAMLAVVGTTGAGKTVLCKLLCGLHALHSGRIVVDEAERTADDGDLNVFQRKVGLSFQQGALVEELSAFENVALVARCRGVDDVDGKTHEALHAVGLADEGNLLPSELSGGMRRRVGLARAMVSDPALLVLDDVTAGLDPRTGHEVMQFVKRAHQSRGCATVLTTHDVDVVLPFVDDVLLLEGGNVGYVGSVAHIPDAHAPFRPLRVAPMEQA